MARLAGSIYGGLIGALCTSFGLIDTAPGGLHITGGNEWTPLVTGAGVVTGAIVGSTQIFRSYTCVLGGVGLGMLFAILLRDEWSLQPPLVFLDLFGVPVVGAAIGFGIDTWRRRKVAPALLGLVGLVAVFGLGAWMYFLIGSGWEESSECVHTDEGIACEMTFEG